MSIISQQEQFKNWQTVQYIICNFKLDGPAFWCCAFFGILVLCIFRRFSQVFSRRTDRRSSGVQIQIRN